MYVLSSFYRIVLASSLAASFVAALPASAQLGVSPLFLEEQVVRGRGQGVITFTNNTNKSIRARVYAEPFAYERNGFVSVSEDATDLSPYLQFSPRESVIEPGTQQQVRLLGLFPPSLPDGEYRTVVFAEELTERSQEGSNVAIKARIGTTVYMRQGELSANIVGLAAAPAQENNQVLELLVNNKGAATARTNVRWKLQQDSGEIASGEVEGYTVMAGGDRAISLPLPSALPSGRYTLTGDLHWVTLGKGLSEPFELSVLVP